MDGGHGRLQSWGDTGPGLSARLRLLLLKFANSASGLIISLSFNQITLLRRKPLVELANEYLDKHGRQPIDRRLPEEAQTLA
ncbi:hypothetical protein LMG28614_05722 [Paraburkholderia ultramafica]|uniref:Uncharacterized protein n=1 Tax=Paraburkholderia ultramafica TaxID=1544867 RepID=A0A6S7BYD7_9BURK|nr:hypothetical protein LMG28614_05722 [Paraburkholderia ultramafica]